MHAEYTLLMSVALDGQATDAETHRLREHLRSCADCAALWERWQVMDRRLAAAPLVAPPEDLVDKVAARLEAHELRRRRARWLGSGLLASWLAVLLFGLAAAATLTIWGARHPAEVRMALVEMLRLVDGVSWLLIGLVTRVGRLGAPTVAAGFGMVATLTCALGMLWLWVMGRSQIWLRRSAPVAE
jgi:predicted anti-sigma-YlaC factor YlaD